MIEFRHVIAVLAMATAMVFASGVGQADSWKSSKGKSKGKHGDRYEEIACPYRVPAHRNGPGKRMQCRGGASFVGGPPPWAPAHGYRAKRDSGRAEPYIPPFDLSLGRCNRDLLGAVIGGGAGAVLGSQIGKGSGQTVAVIGGTIIGILVGGSIGRTMCQGDQNGVVQALEHAPDGQAIVWQDPNSNAEYRVAPLQTVQATEGQYCREYMAQATVGGQKQETYGLACRQPDGAWKIVQ